MSESKAPGRPVSEEVSQSLKKAALELVREKGYHSVSIGAIARLAGVARQSLYNRWTSKADLVLEAFYEEAEANQRMPGLDESRDPKSALEDFLRRIFQVLDEDGDLLRNLIASAQDDAEFRDTLRERFVLPRERIVTALLLRAQQEGCLPADRDVETLSEFVHGAFWYRMLNGLPLTGADAERITRSIFAGGA